ncbi:MAG TPA: TonB family protein [Burkholderiaceae bacterium]
MPRLRALFCLSFATCAPAMSAPVLDPAHPCVKVDYPREARRYEVEGKNAVAFLVDSQGKVLEKRIHLSSGSAMLDRGVLAGLENCKQAPFWASAKAEPGWSKLMYIWQLDGPRKTGTPPQVLPETCTPNATLARVEQGETPGTVLLRFLVSREGKAYGVKVEQASGDTGLDNGAAAHIATCTFRPAMENGAASGGVATARYRDTMDKR